MKIENVNGKTHYYDMNGKEIHEGDCVVLEGKEEKVYLTSEDELGVDAINPLWIKSGKAIPTEFGIYPFSIYDEPVLCGINH